MKKLLLVVSVAVVAVTVYLLLPDSDVLQDGELVQTGSVKISDSASYLQDVVYPKNFSSSPRVAIKFSKGRGFLEIVEQRADGFTFKTSHLGYIEAEGAHVEWTATGFIMQ